MTEEYLSCPQIGSSQPINGTTTSPQVPFVISHPKMAKLLEIVLEHHQKFANEGKSTRIMIFSQVSDAWLQTALCSLTVY